MSVPWLKSMIGYGPWQTEELLKEIPNPEIELGIHVTTKTVQAGSLIGGVLVGPLMKMLSKDPAKKLRWSQRAGLRGALLGLVVGPAMTYGKIKGSNLDYHGLYDRCYRLRHNQWQLMFDRATYLGALAGGALFGLRGIPFGINMAVISVFAFKNGLPLLNPPAENVESGHTPNAQPPKSLLPNFSVKEGFKAPKDAYKGDGACPMTPGKCTCECHSGKCTCQSTCKSTCN